MATAATITGEPVLNGLRTAQVDAGSWERLDRCPLCGSGEDLVDVGVVEAETTGPVTAACVACEFGFLARRPTAAWLESYYAGDWDEAGRAKLAGKGVRVKVNPHAHAFCAPHLPERAAVLDAGAGYGRALLAFKEAGHDVQALEPSEHRAQY